ncbi:prenyltransferase/squalene oxidase repeat-containing protein [Amycolatopsis samaneae]|uniref:Prenyltransferase/squalene oxidase repeat-containing protein n=1 Tax=Amycolatopsis samaneae TaxID=664691 RepID=A0ABW5GPH8_9PSEU
MPEPASLRDPARETVRRAGTAVERAARALLDLRRPDGGWSGVVSAAAVATGAAVIALHRADPAGNADLVGRACGWLRRVQDSSGGWGEDVGAPATLTATGIAIAGLAVAEPGASAGHIERGLARIDAMGGMAALSDRSRCALSAVVRQFLAYGGLYDQRLLPRVPVELALLPRSLRSKLSFTVPGAMSWGVMHAYRPRKRSPVRTLVDRLAVPKALGYLAELQDFGGESGGYEESPLLTACVCVGLDEAGVRPDIVGKGLRYLRETIRADGSWSVNRDLEISVGSYVVAGLADAGCDDLERTLLWLRGAQRFEPFFATGAPPGGWGWACPSGWPNSGDTASVLLALAGFDLPPTDPSVAAGVSWLLGTQNRDGSWGCFCRNSSRTLDGPCAVMTADTITALHRTGKLPPEHPAIRRALAWFRRARHPDGALDCRWYTGLTAGTACTLRALGEIGHGTSDVAVACREWLVTQQGTDGGWGGGDGEPSTVEETAWAVLGLLDGASGGYRTREAIDRGIGYLLDRQRADGLWDPAVLGVYFFDVRYASDHHANGHALQALARYRATRC